MKKTNFFGALKDKVVPTTEFPEREHKPTSSRRWTDAHMSALSARAIRRQRDRDIDRTTKRHRRNQLRQLLQKRAYDEIVSVRVLREIDPEGALRLRLIEDGLLQPTRSKIVGWEDDRIDGVIVRSPVTVQVPVAHTPSEILSVVFKTREDVVRRYMDIVEDELNEKVARIAEKRQAGQAKREAAAVKA